MPAGMANSASTARNAFLGGTWAGVGGGCNMDDVQAAKTPVHLWIVGVLALLWNGWGGYDYLMTRMRNTDYLAAMMPGVDPNEMLAYLDAYPIWAQFGWGLGVWAAVLGSILLLLRSRYAVWAFAASLVGMVLSFGYALFMAPPMPGQEQAGMMAYFPLVIVVVGVALFYYAYRQQQRGVLR